jgi:hypothetical protein
LTEPTNGGSNTSFSAKLHYHHLISPTIRNAKVSLSQAFPFAAFINKGAIMSELINNARINRRTFLRIAGYCAGGAALMPLLSAAKPVGDMAVARRSRFYHGTNDGKLLGSMDGHDWKLLADFGPHLEVTGLSDSRNGWMQATLAVGSHSFVLKSLDGKTWYTQDYNAPEQT